MCANALNKLFWLLNEKILLNKKSKPLLCIKLFIWDAISFRLTNTSLKRRSTKENRETLRHSMFKCLFVCLFFRCSILLYVNSLSFLIQRGIFFNWWYTQSTESFSCVAARDFDLYREHSLKNSHMEILWKSFRNWAVISKSQ